MSKTVGEFYMKVLLFAGSLRKDSFNKKLVNVAKSILDKDGKNSAIVLDLQTLNLPLYDGDIETKGIPEGVTKLAEAMKEADAIIISTPEYNGSISSVLKTAIDWTSRVKPMPMVKKQILLLGASPGGLGAIRGLNHARAPFEALGNYVYPEPFGLARAHEAFDENGNLKDPAQYEKVQKLMSSFISYCERK